MSTTTPDSATQGVMWPAIPQAGNAAMFAILFQMERSQWWSPQAIRAQQFRQIQTLVDHAAQHVPLYRDRLGAVAGLPDGKLNDDLWRQVPILSRPQVQDAKAKFFAKKVPKQHGQPKVATTSGSTGRPLKLRTTGVMHLYRCAVNVRGHLWHDRDLSGKVAMVRRLGDHRQEAAGKTWAVGYTTGPVIARDIGGRIDDHLDWLVGEDPNYLVTYPTQALAMGMRARERGLSFSNLREISSMGEVLTPDTRERCREYWGVPVIDVYSAYEAGNIALQCPGHDHYLVQAECLLVEILDNDDQPCSPGQIGRVVVTVLHNFASPLIRYEIGDFAEVGGPCPTGRGLPVLNQIMGRTRNMVMTPEGDRRWVRISGKELTKIEPLRQIQFRQQVPQEIELLAVVAQPLNPSEEELLRDAAMRALGYPFTLSITYVDEIPRLPGGKYEDVHSELTAC